MSSDLYTSFPSSTSEIWNDVAKKELGGKDPIETLTKEKQGLQIKPYYDEADLDHLPDFSLRTSSEAHLGPRGWNNTPIVSVQEDKLANIAALDHLNNGADGIIFRISKTVQPEILLNGIELPYCSIFFQIQADRLQCIYDFSQWVDTKGFDKTKIVGGVFWETPIQEQGNLLETFNGWSKFHVLGYIIESQQNVVSEIVEALLMGVQTISKNDLQENAIRHLAFSFSIGSDFFIEIVKLKVFRRLWTLVQSAYSKNHKDFPISIHGLSTCWNNEKYQPNANMLKSTTAALSAILGGCDFITVEPEEESPLKSRIARNVLSLLREESHLNQTADAAAGSYYLESLMDQLANQAWSQFQNSVK